MENLSPLLKRLVEAKIDFVIVGGFAAILHGSTFVTRDLDLCAVLSNDTIENLRYSLKDLSPVHRISSPRLSFLDTPKPGEKVGNLYLQTDFGAIDILSTISGIGGFEDLKKNAVEIQLYGIKVLVISVEDLIKSKETLGRDKDLLVVKELKAILEKRNV